MTNPKYFQDLDRDNVLHGVFQAELTHRCPDCNQMITKDEFHNGECKQCDLGDITDEEV